MSFILEALKKSEQQRQDKNTSAQQVRKRTLSLTARPSGRRPYWLLAGLLPLALFCGWWLYSETGPAVETSSESSVVASVPVISPPKQPETLVTTPDRLESVPPMPAVVAEPAPVPSIYVSAPAAPAKPISIESHEFAVQPRQVDAEVTTTKLKNDEQAATESIEPSAAYANAGMPLYADLSREMRDRMPRLSMSMHFYNSDPNRRLVRINDRLLHEGDLVGRDLELVEITSTGVVLDFMGKIFELPGSKR